MSDVIKSGAVVGVAFYSREEWDALRAASADPDILEDTYDEWLDSYRAGVTSLRASGMLLKRVDVRLASLEAWCRHNGKCLDGEARAAYAADLLRRLSNEGFVLPDAP